MQAKDKGTCWLWYSFVVNWRGRRCGGVMLQVCRRWRYGWEKSRSPVPPLGGGCIFFPLPFLILCSIFPLASTAAAADADLVQPFQSAAAERTDRAQHGGGMAREPHICLGNSVFPRIISSRRWLLCFIIGASWGIISDSVFVLNFLIFVLSSSSLSLSQWSSTSACFKDPFKDLEKLQGHCTMHTDWD